MATVTPTPKKLTLNEIKERQKAAWQSARTSLLPAIAQILHEEFSHTPTWVPPEAIFNSVTLAQLPTSIDKRTFIKGLFPLLRDSSEQLKVQNEESGTISYSFLISDFALLRHQFGSKQFLLGWKLSRNSNSVTAIDTKACNVNNLPRFDDVLDPSKQQHLNIHLKPTMDAELRKLGLVYGGLPQPQVAAVLDSPIHSTITRRLLKEVCSSDYPRLAYDGMSRSNQTRVLRHMFSALEEKESLQARVQRWSHEDQTGNRAFQIIEMFKDSFTRKSFVHKASR